MGLSLLTQLEYLLRLLVAAFCGAAIGYERESRMKLAGIRTHIIVSLAAALMMLISKYGFYDIIELSGVGLDPSRVASGVVSAVGFLGAGVIFVRKQTVSGLTTAAGIWATVGVGTAVGAGMYFIGVTATGFLLLLQFLLHKGRRFSREMRNERIVLEVAADTDMDHLFAEIFESNHIEITELKAKKLEEGRLSLALSVKYPDRYEIRDVLRLLHEIPAIHSIEL